MGQRRNRSYTPGHGPYRWAAVAWPAPQPTDAGYGVQQMHELRDIVTVSAGQRDGERSSVPVDDQVVFAAGPGPIDRRRSGVSPRGTFPQSCWAAAG